MGVIDDGVTASAEPRLEDKYARRQRTAGWIVGIPLALLLSLIMLGQFTALVSRGGQ